MVTCMASGAHNVLYCMASQYICCYDDSNLKTLAGLLIGKSVGVYKNIVTIRAMLIIQ